MFDLDDPTLRGPRQIPKGQVVPQDTFERDLAVREMKYFNGDMPRIPPEGFVPREARDTEEDNL